MKPLYDLRRRLALILCPDLGGSPRMAGFHDIEGLRAHVRARREWLEAERAGRSDRASKEPFLSPEMVADLRADLRHDRLERAKEVLKVVQSVQLDGLPGDGEPAFDAVAQRLSILLFGNR